MQAISFQPPVYTSPAFASVRPQLVKASVQAMPVCQFGGGKVPVKQTFTLLQKLKNFWAQVKFAFQHIFKRNILSKERTQHHELGHMLSHYASSKRPLGITFNERGIVSGQVIGPQQNGSESIKDHVNNLWNTLSGPIIGDLQILEKGQLQFKAGALTGMHGDMYSVLSIMEKLSLHHPKREVLKSYLHEIYSLDVEAIRAGRDLEGKKKAEQIQAKIVPIVNELLFHSPLKIAVNKLLKLQTAMGPEKLEKLRQGVLKKDGWMFGKTFRTQLYEKVFTAAERQQFEGIYREFEREFLALPEIQALNAKK